MPTKNIVPRATDEGEIGTSAKRWEKVHAKTGSFDYIETTTMSSKMYNDGSTIFGDDASDTHDFTGSVRVEGEISASLSVSASAFYGKHFYSNPVSDFPAFMAAGGGTEGDLAVLDGQNLQIGHHDGVNPGTFTNRVHINSSGDVGINKATGLSHKLEVEGDISASINISASAFYGDGQHLDNVGGNLQDVTDLGSVTTNNITASGYYFGSSDGKIYDDDGEFRIRVISNSQDPFEIRSGADATYDNEITCLMERPASNERANVLFGSGLNSLQVERQLEVISRDRLDSSYGVLFGTNEASKFMNLEIRTADDDSYSALDLTTTTGLGPGDLQTPDYFGDADISGFRLRYMEDDLQLKIQSGNGATVNDRMAFDRDEDHVIIGGSDTTNLNSNWAALAINSDSGFGGFVSFEQAGTQKAAIFSSNDDLYIKADAEINFQPANTNPSPMVLDTGGNLGIGTVAPEVPLDVPTMGGLVIAQSYIQPEAINFFRVPTSESALAGDFIVVTGSALGIEGCTDPTRNDYIPTAAISGACPTGPAGSGPGCTDSASWNYQPNGDGMDDGSCSSGVPTLTEVPFGSSAATTTTAKITFTVPSNGKVAIKASFYVDDESNNSGTKLWCGLSDSSTYSSLGSQYEFEVFQTEESDNGIQHVEWLITGLTPGASHTYYIGMRAVNVAADEIYIKWGGTKSWDNLATDTTYYLPQFPPFTIKALTAPDTIGDGT